METVPTYIVADAGPLIHLDELDSLDLLSDFSQILVADDVWYEIGRHRPTALTVPDLPVKRVAQSEYPIIPSLQIVAQALELDLGETSALAIMAGNPKAIFLTDDAAARLAAESSGYAVHGTIGVLLRAIRRHQRSVAEVLALLQSLPDRSTLHIAPKLLATVIAEVEQYSRNTPTLP